MEFHFLQTEDGSPSLKLGPDAEGMHNIKGAFSETVYIYGRAIEHALIKEYRPSFVSVGLGLGYNEILTTALLLLTKTPLKEVYGESFEAVNELTENFLKWLSDDNLTQEFQHAYDAVLGLTSKHTGVGCDLIKSTLLEFQQNAHWKFRGELSTTTTFERQFSCFLFDAFSSKTSPELWSEQFISKFLNETSEESAVLSTYACTGTLKRALLANNFAVSITPGFAGKRESTFAFRESVAK